MLNIRKKSLAKLTFPDLGLEMEISSLTALEEISKPYIYTIVIHHQEELSEKFLASKVKIIISNLYDRNALRYFHGIVTEVLHESSSGFYQLIIKPEFFGLELSEENNIFHDQNEINIIKSMFKRYYYTSYDFRLVKDPGKKDYIVQYGETPQQFVLRLFAQLRLFFYYESHDDESRLVITDSVQLISKPHTINNITTLKKNHRLQNGLLRLEYVTQDPLLYAGLCSLQEENVLYISLQTIHTVANEVYSNSTSLVSGKSLFLHLEAPRQPKIDGYQVATVLQHEKDSGYVESNLSVRVRFSWKTSVTTNYSCWIRVSQLIASKNFGSVVVPQVGDEVVLLFLEGNPEKPIIIGSLYNELNAPTCNNLQAQHWYTLASKNENNKLIFSDETENEAVYFTTVNNFITEIGTNQNTTVKNGNVNLLVQKGYYSTVVNKSILLKVGENSLTINQEGITLKGNMIYLN